jgi:hypothetical protein
MGHRCYIVLCAALAFRKYYAKSTAVIKTGDEWCSTAGGFCCTPN